MKKQSIEGVKKSSVVWENVDPERFQGTVYRAANWSYLGDTRGSGLQRNHPIAQTVFVKPLQVNARCDQD